VSAMRAGTRTGTAGAGQWCSSAHLRLGEGDAAQRREIDLRVAEGDVERPVAKRSPIVLRGWPTARRRVASVWRRR